MQANRGYFVEVGKSLRLKFISIRHTMGKQHQTGFIIGSRKARLLGMNHLVGDQRGLKFMVIPQPSLSEKVINRAASPTHSFESFGIISTDSFSFHSLGVGSLAQSPATLNPSKEPTNPDTNRQEEHTSEH